MPVMTLVEAEAFDFDGNTARPLAVPSRGSTELAVWHLAIGPAVEGQKHTVDHEEVFVVRSGHLTGVLGDEPYELTPGDALVVPPDVPFTIANAGAETAHLLVCTSAEIKATLNGTVVVPPWAR